LKPQGALIKMPASNHGKEALTAYPGRHSRAAAALQPRTTMAGTYFGMVADKRCRPNRIQEIQLI